MIVPAILHTIAAMILMSVCLLLGVAAAVVPAVAKSTEDTAIREIIQAQQTAWNAGDSHAWAADFADDADFINILGTIFHGKAEIDQRHAVIFAGPFHGSHVEVSVRSLKLLAPTVALVETDHEVKAYRGLPPGIVPTSEGVLVTHMKYVLTKSDGHWTIVAAQNTAERPR